MPISLLQAAKLTGLDKSTLRKAVRDGRISGTRDDTGRWWVEPCEVERIYPISPAADPQANPRSSIPGSAPGTPGDAATDMLVTTLREALARLEKDVDRERERANQERERNDQLTADLRKLTERLALPAPRPEPTPETWWQKVQRIRWGTGC